MGHLFLPVQYESLFETSSALKIREPMQYLISLSASFGNVWAQYHLREILKMYKEPGVMKSTKSFISTLVKTLPKQLNEPHYYAGLLCISRGKMDRSCEHFKLGYEKGDMWSCYRFEHEKSCQEESQPIFEKLRALNPGLAKLLLAELEKDREKKESMYLEAGHAGIAEGYRRAGILERNDDSDLSCNHYLKAAMGKEGIIEAYDDVAKTYLKERKIEQAKELYLKKAKAGDPKGFVQCGDLYWSEGKKNEAFDCYEQAGFSGYQRRVHRTNDVKRKMELFHEQESKLVEK